MAHEGPIGDPRVRVWQGRLAAGKVTWRLCQATRQGELSKGRGRGPICNLRVMVDSTGSPTLLAGISVADTRSDLHGLEAGFATQTFLRQLKLPLVGSGMKLVSMLNLELMGLAVIATTLTFVVMGLATILTAARVKVFGRPFRGSSSLFIERSFWLLAERLKSASQPGWPKRLRAVRRHPKGRHRDLESSGLVAMPAGVNIVWIKTHQTVMQGRVVCYSLTCKGTAVRHSGFLLGLSCASALNNGPSVRLLAPEQCTC
eukprot:6483660-Amphidinium_carterae.4